jgi:hypothetical protein
MSELPRTEEPQLEADRIEEAFATFADRVHELEAVAGELRAELKALRAERGAPAALDELEEDEAWPADGDATPPPSPDWVADVPPPLRYSSAAPRLVAEAGFLVVVALLAGLANLSAVWIVLVMVLAWALVALSEWAAAERRARWNLDEIAAPASADADLDTTGAWDMPVVQATAIQTADDSESHTVVAQLPPEAEPAADAEQTMVPSAPPGRRLRFWRRTPVETTPDPWEA